MDHHTRSATSHRAGQGLALVAALLTIAQSPEGRGPAVSTRAVPAAVVDRFLTSEGPPLESYRALRTLAAQSRGGRMQARLTAWTSVDAAQGFRYEIVEEEGSAVIRKRVLRAALEAERSLRETGDAARGALVPANYEFTEAQDAGDGLLQIGIRPKRRDTVLVEGRIPLTEQEGDLVGVEGSLVKRPSFWTRHVDVVRRYARIGGVRVPVLMHSTAQVLVAGRSTFSMRYDYESINGARVGDPHTALEPPEEGAPNIP